MGSKKLIGENIEYIANYDSHPGAQFNSEFRSLVKSEIAKLTADDTVANSASGCIEAKQGCTAASAAEPKTCRGAADTSAKRFGGQRSSKSRKPKCRSDRSEPSLSMLPKMHRTCRKDN